MSYAFNREWSDRFLPEMKRIAGGAFIGEAPVEEDQRRNTDLIVLRLEPIRLACRIRRESYLRQFSDEFTIRYPLSADSPTTEFTKIMAGWGDYILYGFGNENGSILKWTIGDLSVFRLWVMRQMNRNGGSVPGEYQPNGDGRTAFRSFKWLDFPSDFIHASSELVEA